MRRLPMLIGLACLGMRAQDLGQLVKQLENRWCGYSSNPFEACRLKSWPERAEEAFWALWLPGPGPYECPLGAARCLEKMGRNAAGAAPALMKALREGPDDFDTGDGVIGVRSGIASALAATGDVKAVGVLAEALRTRPGGAEIALLRALGSFGLAAGGHWELAAGILRGRNADHGFRSVLREQFERLRAAGIVLQDLKRAAPGRAEYVVPNQAVAEARARLDRGSPEYARDFERQSPDHTASAAAWALGRMGRRAATAPLIETLKNPHAAAEAARALGELGASTPDVMRALEAAARSPELGPRARAECANALGRLRQAAGAVTIQR